MRLPVRLAICVGLAYSVGIISVGYADCSTPATRHVVKFYEYQGGRIGDAVENFKIFRNVIDDEIHDINDSIHDLNDSVEADGQALVAEPRSEPYAAGQLDSSVSYDVMTHDLRILELLDGRMQRKSSEEYLVHSNIYIFTPTGLTKVRPLSEDFILAPVSYKNAHPIHLAAIFYALSVDAGQRSCNQIQIYYLNRAWEVLSDTPSDSAGASTLASLVQSDQRALGLSQ